MLKPANGFVDFLVNWQFSRTVVAEIGQIRRSLDL